MRLAVSGGALSFGATEGHGKENMPCDVLLDGRVTAMFGSWTGQWLNIGHGRYVRKYPRSTRHKLAFLGGGADVTFEEQRR